MLCQISALGSGGHRSIGTAQEGEKLRNGAGGEGSESSFSAQPEAEISEQKYSGFSSNLGKPQVTIFHCESSAYLACALRMLSSFTLCSQGPANEPQMSFQTRMYFVQAAIGCVGERWLGTGKAATRALVSLAKKSNKWSCVNNQCFYTAMC